MGQASNDCMSDKETRLANLLKQKAKKKINVNVNMDPFGDDFKDYLKQFLIYQIRYTKSINKYEPLNNLDTVLIGNGN